MGFEDEVEQQPQAHRRAPWPGICVSFPATPDIRPSLALLVSGAFDQTGSQEI
jgi:hypothetical protein